MFFLKMGWAGKRAILIMDRRAHNNYRHSNCEDWWKHRRDLSVIRLHCWLSWFRVSQQESFESRHRVYAFNHSQTVSIKYKAQYDPTVELTEKNPAQACHNSVRSSSYVWKQMLSFGGLKKICRIYPARAERIPTAATEMPCSGAPVSVTVPIRKGVPYIPVHPHP